jgi:hypothetical protein
MEMNGDAMGLTSHFISFDIDIGSYGKDARSLHP